MTGLVRKATLLTAAGLLAATAAMAGVPSAANSTTPSLISLMGSTAGVGDPIVFAPPATAATQPTFTVIVRDLANNPLSGASVVVDLSGCSELALCDDQLDANALVTCVSKTTRKFTDGLGAVTFTVLGGGNGNPAATLLGGGKIFANGTLIASPTVCAYDLDGSLGAGAGDLSKFLGDFASAINYGRSDFDGSGTLGAGDLSRWLTVFALAGSQSSCATACP
jgi:hypothetical protein